MTRLLVQALSYFNFVLIKQVILMVNRVETLTDEEFLQQFEALLLAPEHFNHLGHIRLAWLYLTRLNFEKANHKICTGIKCYAEHLGADEKFHLTITDAIVKIIFKRLNKLNDKSWESFVKNNQDIIVDALSVLTEYYTKERLFSDVARKILLTPDIKPI